MAVINNSREILEALKKNSGSMSLDIKESARISASINKEMEIVKRDYSIMESLSIESAANVILTN
jgi:hypothetical protein